MMLRNVNNNQV